MIKVLIYIFLFGLSISINAQISWIANTAGNSIALDNSNNVYTVDYVYSQGGDIFLTKRNSSGQFLWEASYDQTDVTKWEKSTWVEADNAGNVIVTGTLMSGYSNPVIAASIIMKFNSAGTLLWRQVFETSFEGSQTKKCLVDDQNNIYVLGTGINGSNGLNLKVKKFSPDGTPLWTYYNAIGLPVNFKFTPDNAIVVTSRGITGSINGYAKLDRNGNGIWSLPGINSTTTGDAAGDAFGNTYLVNLEYVFNPSRSIVKKIDPAGAEIWSSYYTIAGLRVEVGTDNMPVISGYPTPGTFGSSFVKFSTTGTTVWANMNADSTFSLLMHAQMKMDSQNNIYLAAGTMTEMAVCKINSNGSSGRTITIPGSGYAYGIEIGSDNSIFVVGGNTAGSTARLFQSITSISNSENSIAGDYWLGNNYPNPFNPVTNIEFQLPHSSMVKLTVFDMLGREVEELVNENMGAGTYKVDFDGSRLASGVYFYRLQTGDFSVTKKMILIK